MNNSWRTEYALAWTIIIVFAVLLLIYFFRGIAHATECQTEPNDKGSWSWRYVEPHEHKKCWYQGRRVLPKSQLHWVTKQEDKPKPVKTDVLPPKAETPKKPDVLYPALSNLQHGVSPDLLNTAPSTTWPLILDVDAMQAQAKEEEFNELDAQADEPKFNDRWPRQDEMFVRKAQ